MRRSIYEPLWIAAAVFAGAWLATTWLKQLRKWLLRHLVNRWPALRENLRDEELEAAASAVNAGVIERFVFLDLFVFGLIWIVFDLQRTYAIPGIVVWSILVAMLPLSFVLFYAYARRRIIQQAGLIARRRGVRMCFRCGYDLRNGSETTCPECGEAIQASENQAAALEKPAPRFACPCCACLTLDQEPPGTFKVCPVCFWEDDDVQFRDPNAAGANDVDLNTARQNYREFGACTRFGLKHVRPPKPEELQPPDSQR